MGKFKAWSPITAGLLLCLVLFSVPSSLLAVEPQMETAGLQSELEESFQRVLDNEREKHALLLTALKRAQDFETELDRNFDKDLLQISTYRNQLFAPSIHINDLRAMARDISVTSARLSQYIRDAEEHLADVRRQGTESHELVALYEKQLELIREREELSGFGRLNDLLDRILVQLRVNEELIENIEAVYEDPLTRLREMKEEMKMIAGRVSRRIDQEMTRAVFHRDVSPVFRFFQEEWGETAISAANNMQRLLSSQIRPEGGKRPWRIWIGEIMTVVLMLSILGGGLVYLARQCRRLRAACHPEKRFWQKLIVALFQYSLPLAGAILFFHIYLAYSGYRLPAFHFFLPLLMRLLTLWLVVQWGLILIRMARREMPQISDPRIDMALGSLKRLLQGILVFGIFYLLVKWMICQNCLAPVALRLAGEIALFVWTVFFVRRILNDRPSVEGMNTPFLTGRFRSLLAPAAYGLASAGLIFELAGYGGLAAWWYVSWGKTAVVLFWAVLLFRALKEFEVPEAETKTDPECEPESAVESDRSIRRSDPVRWAVTRLARLMLTLSVLILIPVAWGAEKTFPADLFEVLNYRFRFGDVEINTMGLIYALLVLFVVNIISVLWQGLLQDKIFSQARMEEGLKLTVSRISTYVLWIIGILMALRIVGFSSTSLTVIFGALGIGIGFGLQHIVGNFISGIILLFERPMQVGDVIELDGTWGVVKEINVRSTHLKTYDNSDLIVPNSDFISQRLVNWSFRDPKVRRTITVGVAYGSDIARVTKVLLDIAHSNTRVYRHPDPLVLFTDFGDSALIFKLRIWAHIEYFLSVESEIRSEIDRRFCEADITIPFPQRDLYIKEVRNPEPNKMVINQNTGPPAVA